MTASPIVELKGLSRTFPGSPPVEAVKPVDVVIGRGDYVAVEGPSGSGKSTLLHLIGCLDRPTSGEYRLGGRDVSGLSDRERTGLRGAEIGFVFQAFHLLSHRTVLDNVMTSLLYNRTPRKDRRSRAMSALSRVGLEHRVDFFPTQLSGGEKQRVAIARAVAPRPSLLLCDEPTGNLDTATTESILDLFDDLLADGLTMMVITHELRVAERARRRVGMVDGMLTEAS